VPRPAADPNNRLTAPASGAAPSTPASPEAAAPIARRVFDYVLLGQYPSEEDLGLTRIGKSSAPVGTPRRAADVPLPGGGSAGQSNSVSGFGDMAIVPVMLAWKKDDWQIDAMLPIFAPTGNYQKGRLGNTGLNYWTFDPIFGVVYSNAKSGFNALLNTGFAINTENPDTNYKSGNLLHFDGAIQQILPVGKGLMTLGAEGFYFQQVSCDSGSGASLGCFKGRTTGLGPVLGYIQPFSKTESLVLEFKWLFEMDVKNRLDGDYIWLKAVYKF